MSLQHTIRLPTVRNSSRLYRIHWRYLKNFPDSALSGKGKNQCCFCCIINIIATNDTSSLDVTSSVASLRILAADCAPAPGLVAFMPQTRNATKQKLQNQHNLIGTSPFLSVFHSSMSRRLCCCYFIKGTSHSG